MAEQITSYTEGAVDKFGEVTENASERVQGYASGLVGTIQGFANRITTWGQSILDRFFPPEQRAEFLARIQAFMVANPKLSGFIGMNIALTGIPLALFVLFSITCAVFALLVGLIIGLLGAVIFTVTCVGLALMFVFPTIFFTTMVSCFLFLWGLGGYYIFRWVNGSSDEDAPYSTSDDDTVGDKLNSMTGGRLTGFVDAAKAEKAKGDITGFSDQHTKPKPPPEKSQPNGSANQKQDVGSSGSNASPASNLHKATKATGVESATKPAANVTGTVKGGVSGSTGLKGPL